MTPSETSECLMTDYSAAATELTPEQLFDFYAETREHPISYSTAHGGFWMVSRYQDVMRVLKDTEGFSVEKSKGGGLYIPPYEAETVFMEYDNDIRRHYKRMLQRFFTSAAVDGMSDRIAQVTNDALDAVIAQGEFDLVHDLAELVPAKVTLGILGFPTEEWRRFAEPQHMLFYVHPGHPEYDDMLVKDQWVRDRVWEIIEERKAEPRDDVASHLLEVKESEAITDKDVFIMLHQLILGGLETVGNQISHNLVYLDRDRKARQRLIDHPELIPAAVEELLRLAATVHAMARTVTRDTELGGQHLKVGDRVLVMFAAADRDDREFVDADRFVCPREANRHVAFSFGDHFCMGAWLARKELQTVTAAVLDRMPNYEVDYDRAVQYPVRGLMNGWVTAPARVGEGAR